MIGAKSPFLAVRAFCMFAAVTIVMLYLSQVTLFLCFVAWDAKRVAFGFHECCYLCFCRKDSLFFCRGRLMTPSQKEFLRRRRALKAAQSKERSSNKKQTNSKEEGSPEQSSTADNESRQKP